uniref:Secreted protein n=1 Tax=Arundo donax TaxID=35708 RepID=A0A0A9F0P2_ARUDO
MLHNHCSCHCLCCFILDKLLPATIPAIASQGNTFFFPDQACMLCRGFGTHRVPRYQVSMVYIASCHSCCFIWVGLSHKCRFIYAMIQETQSFCLKRLLLASP